MDYVCLENTQNKKYKLKKKIVKNYDDVTEWNCNTQTSGFSRQGINLKVLIITTTWGQMECTGDWR